MPPSDAPDRVAARDCGGDPTQKLAEGEQAARGAAEPTRENLARVHVGSSPDAGSAARVPRWRLLWNRLQAKLHHAYPCARCGYAYNCPDGECHS